MIVLKILAAPVMVALSLLAAMVTFLFCVASAVCELGCIYTCCACSSSNNRIDSNVCSCYNWNERLKKPWNAANFHWQMAASPP